MNITTALSPTARSVDGYPDLPQYTWRQVLAFWVAVTAPMSILGWLVAPWLSHRISTRDPFIDALVFCFNAGLIWMCGLVLIIVRREQGSLSWATLCDALWLRKPRDVKTGRVGGRIWWWALLFTALSGMVNALPIDPTGPLPRDLPKAILTTRVENYFHGNWIGFAMMAFNAFLAPVVEELVFRGLLLPRTRALFGKGNVVANGTLFTLYHLHQPWSMPNTWIDGVVDQAYPSWRFRSTWMGIITHTAPSFVTVTALLFFVV
jgi:CAAX protease family protein